MYGIRAIVTSNRATVTLFVTVHVTLTYDLLTCGSMHAERLQYTCTKFGADSSSRFPVRARTDRQTDANERPTHVVGNNEEAKWIGEYGCGMQESMETLGKQIAVLMRENQQLKTGECKSMSSSSQTD